MVHQATGRGIHLLEVHAVVQKQVSLRTLTSGLAPVHDDPHPNTSVSGCHEGIGNGVHREGVHGHVNGAGSACDRVQDGPLGAAFWREVGRESKEVVNGNGREHPAQTVSPEGRTAPQR